MNLRLGIGESKPVSVQGDNFYYSSGDYRIKVKVIGVSERREYELSAGQGFKLDSRFSSLEITNLGIASQDIEFEATDAEVYDNRAVLANTSAMPVSISPAGSRLVGQMALPAGIATAVLPGDNDRIKTMLVFAGNVYLGFDNTVSAVTGFLWTGGSLWIDENTAALWAFSAAGTTVNMIQDRK